MKIYRFIQYFFYVGLNWGWKIAFVITGQELKGEKKYGIDTTGADELKTLKRKGIDVSHATMYMPVSYPLLEKTLDEIPVSARKHFVDIGSGKGRALCVAAHFGFQKLTGIDFSVAFCREAVHNLHLVQQTLPAIEVAIVEADAASWPVPPDADCIFLFNPFDETIMQKVLNNIQQSLAAHPRHIRIIYANPLHKELFLKARFNEIYYSKKMEQFEISILCNE